MFVGVSPPKLSNIIITHLESFTASKLSNIAIKFEIVGNYIVWSDAYLHGAKINSNTAGLSWLAFFN